MPMEFVHEPGGDDDRGGSFQAPMAEEVPDAPNSAADMPDINTSGMARLRDRYEKLDDGIEKFTIPAYGELIEGFGMVWPFMGRYRRLEPETIRHLRKVSLDFPDPPTAFNISLLVESCVELGTRGEVTVDEPDGEFVPLSNDPENPIRWDERLAQGLGFKVNAPDSLIGGEVIRQAFKGNLQAVNEHSADVYGWMIYGRAVITSKQEKETGKA